MKHPLLAAAAFVLVAACSRKVPPSPSPSSSASAGLEATVRRSESLASAKKEARKRCPRVAALYAGSLAVAARDYKHSVRRGADDVDEEISGLDRVVTTAKRLHFTLDYPFEKPFEGTVTSGSGITLRVIIDAVRAGFRKLYEGTSESEIPGMYNKDVSGPYGRAFHAIGDLVIEGIDLCEADGALDIAIGS